MKKLISVAAFLAASSALATAGTVVFDDFFGTAGTSSTAAFNNAMFNDTWKTTGSLFSDTGTWFGPVYSFGLKGSGYTGYMNAGTLYFDNNDDNAVSTESLVPSITVADDGSATIDAHLAYKGATCVSYWNTLSADDLASVSDLSISFTGGTGCDTLQLAVFYHPSGSTAPGDVKRLLLEDSFTVGTNYSFKLDGTATGAEASGGALVIAIRNTNTTSATSGTLSDIVISGTAIPEPSAFGLLAGAGALALVAARRRRRAK